MKRLLVLAAAATVAVGGALSASAGTPAPGSLAQRFAYLSSQHSNQCSLRPQAISSLAQDGRLQGSCCTPMVYRHYVQQIQGLRAYARVPEVPTDPYDVSVRLAKRLVSDDRTIQLSPTQQRIYKHAMRMAHEHGPCCCHCWRWTAFEGQAKELIVQRRYGAAQIAKVWDLEDGCGGP